MDELDLMAAESKATYEEVKDYVSEAKRIESSQLVYRTGEAEMRHY